MVDDDGTERTTDPMRGEAAPLATRPTLADSGGGDLATAPTGIVNTPGLPPLSVDQLTRRERPGDAARADSQLSPMADDERYRFGGLLGQGGMGEVVLAHDEHIGREVAVKRIRASEPSDEELARFVREARVQGRLEHPAVVPVHDLAVDREGRPFFVMKRVTGTTMLDLLARLRDAGAADAAATRRLLLRAFADVCLAIEFAHRRGIIHRDLKPANIMLGDFGEVYVLDWGIARAIVEDDAGGPPSVRTFAADLRLDTGDTQIGTVLGTPAYMAPEQLVGDQVGPAADLYALGCILYEITAGVALHPHSRSATSVLAPLDARPSLRRPDAPPELDAICERATRNDPDARFDSARALGGAVQAFLDGDRDLAARAALARDHIAEARTALAAGEDEAHRRTAMRAAGRALALDPSATEAADLVTHLMLKPPRHVPDEVQRELELLDAEAARHQGRTATITMLGYLGFVPFMLWSGVRDPVFIVVFAALAAGAALQLFVLSRRPDVQLRDVYLSAGFNALLIGVSARITGPFLFAPTLAMTTLMAYAAHPKFGRVFVTATILGSAVAIPWALELLGVLAPTYRFTPAGELVLGTSIMRFSAVPVQVGFALFLLTLFAVVGLLSRGLALRQREATHKLELHAWHLRQVVPSLPR